MMNRLIPNIKPKAPESLKSNVINKVKQKQKKVLIMKRITAVAAMLAVLILLPLSLQGNDSKARKLLSESIEKMNDVTSMVIKYAVKTRSNDNFDVIDLSEKFENHTLETVFGNPQIWRIEKSGRTAVFDGKNSYLWIKNIDELYVSGGKSGIFGEMNMYLLNPKDLLENAQKLAKSEGAKIDIKNSENEIILTIEAKAQGDFKNDYLKNSSVAESDNKQVFVFDKNTKLLKNLEISVLNKGKYVAVIKTQSIEYNSSLNKKELISLPDNLPQRELKIENKNSLLTHVSSKKAVEIMLNALKNNDISSVKDGFIQYPESSIKEFYGLEILKIGEAFKSGKYPGEFVPVEIKLTNGSVKKTNLAVRNDNENKIWILDGGF